MRLAEERFEPAAPLWREALEGPCPRSAARHLRALDRHTFPLAERRPPRAAHSGRAEAGGQAWACLPGPWKLASGTVAERKARPCPWKQRSADDSCWGAASRTDRASISVRPKARSLLVERISAVDGRTLVGNRRRGVEGLHPAAGRPSFGASQVGFGSCCPCRRPSRRCLDSYRPCRHRAGHGSHHASLGSRARERAARIDVLSERVLRGRPGS